MKLAVAAQDGRIFQHFGQCKTFAVYSVEDGKILERSVLDTGGNGHAALAGFLKGAGVDAVICGGLGDGAKRMLASAGIGLVSGAEGDVEDAVNAYLSGSLEDRGGTCGEDHHGQEHHCSCEEHCE